MANFLYNRGREGFLTSITEGAFTGQIDWSNDTFGAALVDTGSYIADQANHTNMTQVGGVFQETAITGNTSGTATDGTAVADNTVFTAVAGPGEAGAIVIYRENSTVDADNVLIAYIDSATTTNLPVTLNGGDVTVIWDSNSGRIFKL